jgi:hypothetical protein
MNAGPKTLDDEGAGWEEACRREEEIRRLVAEKRSGGIGRAAVGEAAAKLGISATSLYRLIQRFREDRRVSGLAARPPTLDVRRLAETAARFDLPAANPDALAESLPGHIRGGEDPVSATAKAAASAFSAFPGAPAAEAEIFALWVFDLAIATRLRWARPLPLIATKILDPGLRSNGRGRPRPGEPAWPRTAAGAIALAAASALDLAANLCRRAETLIAAAPKLRSKPAAKIVDLLLAEDCVSLAEAARQAPMTDRAARRLFDRLVAAREISGRPTFRLYGL